jgi:hypothetical protein
MLRALSVPGRRYRDTQAHPLFETEKTRIRATLDMGPRQRNSRTSGMFTGYRPSAPRWRFSVHLETRLPARRSQLARGIAAGCAVSRIRVARGCFGSHVWHMWHRQGTAEDIALGGTTTARRISTSRARSSEPDPVGTTWIGSAGPWVPGAEHDRSWLAALLSLGRGNARR